MILGEEMEEKLYNVVLGAMSAHETRTERGWRVCRCGVRDNMDGDVLDTHQASEVTDAVIALFNKESGD